MFSTLVLSVFFQVSDQTDTHELIGELSIEEKCRLIEDTDEGDGSGGGGTISEKIDAYLITYYRVECDALLSSGYVLITMVISVMIIGIFILAHTYIRTR